MLWLLVSIFGSVGLPAIHESLALQLPSKEELHAFIQQRDARTSVRLMNGAKADIPFEIHETVKDCIPKMARTLGLKTHKSFGLFISHLVSLNFHA